MARCGSMKASWRCWASAASADTIRHMAEQEQRHLKTFDRLVNERKVRPTALEPLWRVAGFALGVATALLGEKAAFACTAAVEEAIDEHYAAQIAEPWATAIPTEKDGGGFPRRRSPASPTALDHGAEQAPGYRFLSEAIKAGCRVAIKLSE